jgi:hypothetical protein
MHTEAQERDDGLNLAGSDPSSRRPAAAEPMLLGDVLAGIVLPDLAVRLRGDFQLPRLMVSRSLVGVETD